jgi:hypothetical protein
MLDAPGECVHVLIFSFNVLCSRQFDCHHFAGVVCFARRQHHYSCDRYCSAANHVEHNRWAHALAFVKVLCSRQFDCHHVAGVVCFVRRQHHYSLEHNSLDDLVV